MAGRRGRHINSLHARHRCVLTAEKRQAEAAPGAPPLPACVLVPNLRLRGRQRGRPTRVNGVCCPAAVRASGGRLDGSASEPVRRCPKGVRRQPRDRGPLGGSRTTSWTRGVDVWVQMWLERVSRALEAEFGPSVCRRTMRRRSQFCHGSMTLPRPARDRAAGLERCVFDHQSPASPF